MSIKSVLYLFAILNLIDGEENVIVNTTNGLIEGKIVYNGGVRAFLSIPYASPPINDLRWRNPVIHSNWNDNILNATIEPWGCPQTCNSPQFKISGLCPPYTKEDCLILSIFTPNNNINVSLNDANYPIMMYFHGGAWTAYYGG
eukprot:554852_1